MITGDVTGRLADWQDLDLRRDCRRLLLISGVLGAGIGVLGGTWQWAVELAQIEAGIVSYPSEALATAVQAHVWSVLTQLVALALNLGVPEVWCSAALSGVMTGLALQAVVLTVFLFARHGTYSLQCGLVILLTRASAHGAVYPAELLPSAHSYGAVGLSLSALIPALAGTGFATAAALLAGLSIAVHATSGVWTIAILALVLAGARERVSRRALVAFVLGLAISAISFLAHELSKPATMMPVSAAEYVRAFVTLWDVHRQPVRWMSAGVWFNLAAMATGAIFWLRAEGPPRMFLAFIVWCGALALIAAAAGTLPYAVLPRPFLLAIPGRFLNVDVVLLAPMLAGTAAWLAGASRAWHATPLALLVALALSNRSPLIERLQPWLGGWQGLPQAPLLAVASAISVVAIAIILLRRSPAGAVLPSVANRPTAWIVAPAAAVCVAGVLSLTDPVRPFANVSDRITLRSDDQPLFDLASRGRGTLLTASNLWLVQLRTRRPVLLEGGTLDTLPYAVEAGPFVSRVLQDVYGVSFFDPPDAGRHLGQLARSFGRERWEQFTLDDWRAISEKYGVTDVIVYRDWTLALPQQTQSRTLALYRIPTR